VNAPDAPQGPAATPDAATGEVRVVGGRYEIRRAIGAGGMGVVYEAENTWTRRRVALKVLDPARAGGAGRAERFMREARAASALRHPNVVDVLDMGQDPADGALYIVQELLLGEDLRALLAREGRLDEARAAALIAPALRGLAAAHAAGIVHRDVKPANLFLAAGAAGEVVPKVIDFGVARDLREASRTADGEAVGTPAYMAPEQLRAEREISPAADVWAVGVVLHEMLAGALPFPADNHNVLVHRVLSGDRAALAESLAHVSAPLRAAIARALEPDPARRFASAAEMLAALELPAGTADTRPARPAAPARPRPRGRALVVALLALVGGTAALAFARGAPADRAPRAAAPAPPDPPPPAPRAAESPAVVAAAAPAIDASAARARVERPRPRAPSPAPAPAPAAVAPPLGRPRARLLSPGGAYPSP
jgi:serine/threonine-protein kinase